jgi:long-chain acyl-CoA synthetase
MIEPLVRATTPSIRERFVELAAAAPASAALIDGTTGEVTTRAGLLERSRAITERLRLAGLVAGERVALQMPNSPDFVATFLAALELGLPLVPLDRNASESELAAVLTQLSIRALVWRGGSDPSELPSISLREVPSACDSRGAVLVKLTSGSTGAPRGILTSERNLVADATSICATMEIGPGDVNFGAIPFSHSYGFSNLVTPLLLQGTAVVCSNEYLPLSMLAIANRFRCTVVPGIPLMFDLLSQLERSDGRFESVRTFVSAGAPLTAAVSRRFSERFGIPLHTFYGCSECGGISYDREGGAVERGSVGRPLAGVEASRADGQGRLAIWSEAVAIGYAGATEEESRRFDDGRFIADDIVRFSAGGELEIVGRAGELINTASRKVNPREVEQVIMQIAGVREVRVYGAPAGARGEVVAAAVVASPDVTRDEIRDYCLVHLSRHKVPRIVKIVDAMPLDDRGKVKRSALIGL